MLTIVCFPRIQRSIQNPIFGVLRVSQGFILNDPLKKQYKNKQKKKCD